MRDLTERVRICEKEQNTSNGTGLPLLNRARNRLHRHFQLLRLSRFISENGSMSNWENTTQKTMKLQRRLVLCFSTSAIEFRRLKSMFASRFTSSPHWSVRLWTRHLERGGGPTKRFQCLIDPYLVDKILYLRTIQSHSGWNPDDPSLQDNVMIPNDFFEYIYHVGSHLNGHPIIDSGLIAGGRNANKQRDTVFFTAVDPLKANLHEQREFDLTKPRIAVYKQKWKVHQNAVYWIKLKLQTRSFSSTLSHHSALTRLFL